MCFYFIIQGSCADLIVEENRLLRRQSSHVNFLLAVLPLETVGSFRDILSFVLTYETLLIIPFLFQHQFIFNYITYECKVQGELINPKIKRVVTNTSIFANLRELIMVLYHSRNAILHKELIEKRGSTHLGCIYLNFFTSTIWCCECIIIIQNHLLGGFAAFQKRKIMQPNKSISI